MIGWVPLALLALVAPALPSDPRLGPVRAELAQIVEQAAQSELPAEALVVKVQEGLAKNVPAARIVAVVRGLAQDLGAARAFAAPLLAGGKPSPVLLRALADAKAAGVSWNDATPLVRLGGEGPVRALRVLTDLATRGYPTDHAAAIVAALAARDPQALPRLAADLDRVRRTRGLTQLETLDALQRALDRGRDVGAGALDRALQKVDDGSAAGAPGQSGLEHGRGPNRDTSGHHGKKP